MSAPEEPRSRHLAVILFADIAGYTDLSARDEDRALALVSIFQAAAREAVDQHGGRIVKFLGDGVLAEFGTAEAAARAALELRGEFAERTAASGTPSKLRVGLNLGEIATDGSGDVYGDGVNTASRLQAAAEPGQILASENVAHQLRTRPTFRLEPRGARRLRGLPEPVRIFAVGPNRANDPNIRGGRLRALRARPILRRFLVPVALVAGVVATWFLRSTTGEDREPALDRSVAVLPFETIGEDPENELFGQGLTMDVIGRLSRIGDLRVISRTSSIGYDRAGKTAPQIGEDLGVGAILEGSVQRSGDRVRIAVRLVDTRSDADLWAETFDREIVDIFAIQSEVAARVARALEATLTDVERTRLTKRPTESLDAYEFYLRGRTLLEGHTEGDTRAAIRAFESALGLDAAYALAHAGLAAASAEMHLRFAAGEEAERWGERAIAEARRALDLDASLAEAHEALAAVYRKTDFDWERTIEESRRALELDPSLAPPHYYIAAAYYHLGLLDEADHEVRKGMAIDPAGDRIEPSRVLGIVALLDGRYSEAVGHLERVQVLSERRVSDAYLAQALHYRGDVAEAETMLEDLRHATSASAAARASATLASFLAVRGERDRATGIADSVAGGSYMDHHVAYSLGAAYAALGRKDSALRWLREGVETGFPCWPWYARDPLLDSLRRDPEFGDLSADLRSSWEAVRSRYGAADRETDAERVSSD